MNFKIIFTFLLTIVLISCKDKEVKINLSDDNYTIDIIDSLPNTSFGRDFDFKAFYRNSRIDYSKYQYMHSSDSTDHYFKNDFLEIEFHRFWVNPIYRCILGIRIIDNKQKAFAIIWTNRNTLENKKKNTSVHTKYTWEVDNTTDTIITNLSNATIKQIYPQYNGIVKKLVSRYIKLNYYHPIYSREFYDNIEFDNYKFGIKHGNFYDKIRGADSLKKIGIIMTPIYL